SIHLIKYVRVGMFLFELTLTSFTAAVRISSRLILPEGGSEITREKHNGTVGARPAAVAECQGRARVGHRVGEPEPARKAQRHESSAERGHDQRAGLFGG